MAQTLTQSSAQTRHMPHRSPSSCPRSTIPISSIAPKATTSAAASRQRPTTATTCGPDRN